MQKIGIEINGLIRDFKTNVIESYKKETRIKSESKQYLLDNINNVTHFNISEFLIIDSDSKPKYTFNDFIIDYVSVMYANPKRKQNIAINHLQIREILSDYKLYFFSKEGETARMFTLNYLTDNRLIMDGVVFIKNYSELKDMFDVILTSNQLFPNDLCEKTIILEEDKYKPNFISELFTNEN